jgi:hypothetical protein
VSGVSIETVGVILMIAGALGLIVTMTIFAPRRRAGGVVEERVVDDRPATYKATSSATAGPLTRAGRSSSPGPPTHRRARVRVTTGR